MSNWNLSATGSTPFSAPMPGFSAALPDTRVQQIDAAVTPPATLPTVGEAAIQSSYMNNALLDIEKIRTTKLPDLKTLAQASPAQASPSGASPGDTGRAHTSWPAGADPVTGPRCTLGDKNWGPIKQLSPDTPILIMAGHADAQGIEGGTPGAAVGLRGEKAMEPGATDEDYWTRVLGPMVVERLKAKGLNAEFYKPPSRSILNDKEPVTNWSVGPEHVKKGGYAMELHFNAYDNPVNPEKLGTGNGSGIIPPSREQTSVDRELAKAFGAFPARYQPTPVTPGKEAGLHQPNNGVALLEIGNLGGPEGSASAPLEEGLRGTYRQGPTLRALADRIADAIAKGMGPGKAE